MMIVLSPDHSDRIGFSARDVEALGDIFSEDGRMSLSFVVIELFKIKALFGLI
jgi:hypothetical protein